MKRNRALLACGVAMPVIYFLMLMISRILNPGFDLLRQEPSELGRARAAYPFVYNFGMVATAVAGSLAAIGFIACRNRGRGLPWDVLAGISLLFASIGVAMAGLFPLPSHLHHAFGLTAAAILTPLLGGLSMWRLGNRSAAAALILGSIVIIGLVAEGRSSLAPCALMFASIGSLCWTISHRTGSLDI